MPSQRRTHDTVDRLPSRSADGSQARSSGASRSAAPKLLAGFLLCLKHRLSSDESVLTTLQGYFGGLNHALLHLQGSTGALHVRIDIRLRRRRDDLLAHRTRIIGLEVAPQLICCGEVKRKSCSEGLGHEPQEASPTLPRGAAAGAPMVRPQARNWHQAPIALPPAT